MKGLKQIIALGQPCYLSLEWALFYHGVSDQPVIKIQCATLKDSFEMEVDTLRAEFVRIPEDCFFGYEMTEDRYLLEQLPLATPEKALLDYLYRQRDEGYSPFLLFLIDWDRLNKQKLREYADRMEPWLWPDLLQFLPDNFLLTS